MNETAASGLTVLRMRLPYVDQRSLSEAWISALGLRRDAPTSTPHGPAAAKREIAGAGRSARATASATNHADPRGGGYPAARTAGARAANVRAPQALPVDSRPVVRADRSVRLVPMHARSYAARQTSLTLGVAGERVQLVLRRDGAVLNVVALCRSDVAQTVGLALARAESFLRSRGDAMCASVRTFDDAVASR